MSKSRKKNITIKMRIKGRIDINEIAKQIETKMRNVSNSEIESPPVQEGAMFWSGNDSLNINPFEIQENGKVYFTEFPKMSGLKKEMYPQ